MSKVKKINKDDNYKKPFPSLLRELIDTYKVKQEDIAKAINVTRQTISKYENGETVPDIYSAKKIVNYFNNKYNLKYSIDYWLGEEEVLKNVKKEEIMLSNEAIENLKKINSEYFSTLLNTVNILLSEDISNKAQIFNPSLLTLIDKYINFNMDSHYCISFRNTTPKVQRVDSILGNNIVSAKEIENITLLEIQEKLIKLKEGENQ